MATSGDVRRWLENQTACGATEANTSRRPAIPITTIPATSQIKRTFLTSVIAAGLVAVTLGAIGATLLRESGETAPTRVTSSSGNLDVLVEGPLVSATAAVRNQDLSVLVEGPLVSSAMVRSEDLSVLVEGPIVSNAMP